VISQGTENLNGVISFQQTIKLTTSENSTIILRQNFVRQDRFIFTLSAVAEEDKYPGYSPLDRQPLFKSPTTAFSPHQS